jgi:uncharacterized protein (DUF2336 family)
VRFWRLIGGGVCVEQVDWLSLLALVERKSRLARERLTVAITDLFIPDALRLTDRERAVMSNLLGNLLTGVELDLRWRLVRRLTETGSVGSELARDLTDPDLELARPVLEGSDLVRDPALVDLVRMRAEEHLTVLGGQEQSGGPLARNVVEKLIQRDDPLLSRRAMEYLVAESRRLDRFDEPTLPLTEAPPDLAERLYWRASAALRTVLTTRFRLEPIQLERALDWATRHGIANLETNTGLASRAKRLSLRLHELDELSDQLLSRSFQEGRIYLFVAGLAERARLPLRPVWRIAVEPDPECWMILARAIEFSRDFAIEHLATLRALRPMSGLEGNNWVERMVAIYDQLPLESARSILEVWRREPEFQFALEQLSAPPKDT